MTIVVKSHGEDVSESELKEYYRNRLSAYKQPKCIEFHNSIPKTPYGKIDKKALRKEYWEGRDRMI